MLSGSLEGDAFLRVERREVFEEQLFARLIRRLEVDRLDLDQREVAFAFLRRPNLTRDRVAGLQIELANLRRRDVDVVRTGQVVVVGRAQEAEAVRQHLEHPFGEDEPALLGLRLQNLKDQFLLAHAGGAADGQVLGDLRELLDAHVLQIGDVQAFARSPHRRRRGGGRLRSGGAGVWIGVVRRGLTVRASPLSGALVITGHENSRAWSGGVVEHGPAARRIQRGVVAELSIGPAGSSFKPAPRSVRARKDSARWT